MSDPCLDGSVSAKVEGSPRSWETHAREGQVCALARWRGQKGMAVALRDELSAQLALVSALVDCAFTASPPPQFWRDLHRLAGASYLDLLCLGVTYVDLAFCW